VVCTPVSKPLGPPDLPSAVFPGTTPGPKLIEVICTNVQYSSTGLCGVSWPHTFSIVLVSLSLLLLVTHNMAVDIRLSPKVRNIFPAANIIS
jgi:hypothetical protein